MTSASAPDQDNPARAQRTTVARIPGVPAGVRACRIDVDGVLIDAARRHAAGWKATFNGYLTAWADAADRFGHRDELRLHGADRVVTDRAPLWDLVDPA